MKNSKGSIKRYLFVIGVCGAVLLVVSWIIFGAYSILTFRSTYDREYELFTANLADELERDLESQDAYIKSVYTENTFYGTLIASNINDNQWIRATNNLDNAFLSRVDGLDYPGGVFYYDLWRNSLRSEYSTSRYVWSEYDFNLMLKEALAEMDPILVNEDFMLTYNGETYLVHVFGIHGRLLGYVINLSGYMEPWEDMQIVLTDQDNTILVNKGTEILDEAALQKRIADQNYASGNSYIFQHHALEEWGFSLYVIKYDSTLLFWHRAEFWFIIVLLPLIFLILIHRIYLFVNRIIYQPINHVTDRLIQMEAGDFKKETEPDSGEAPEEIRVINERLDELIDEMQALNQERYEKEKEADAALLQYYQLQVRPHFYLNCLNIISALLDENDISLVKKMVYSVSRHFRYVFQQFDTLVTLEEEIDEVRDYVEIYVLQNASPLLLQIDMDEEQKSVKVPILCIQTFVENSIKYAVKVKQVLSLNIKVGKIQDEGEDYIRIRISDNGNGYPDELLEQLNLPVTEFQYKSQNVGIDNLKYRIYLLYKDRAKLFFYNNPTSGAVTEILLPMEA